MLVATEEQAGRRDPYRRGGDDTLDRATIHFADRQRRAAAGRQRRSSPIRALRGACPVTILGAAVADGLTAREREIALRAAGGLSRDIAERLVVSVRTVDSHLQRVSQARRVAPRGARRRVARRR
jgi:DNA-binding NarL/FixJ family response regulator